MHLHTMWQHHSLLSQGRGVILQPVLYLLQNHSPTLHFFFANDLLLVGKICLLRMLCNWDLGIVKDILVHLGVTRGIFLLFPLCLLSLRNMLPLYVTKMQLF